MTIDDFNAGRGSRFASLAMPADAAAAVAQLETAEPAEPAAGLHPKASDVPAEPVAALPARVMFTANGKDPAPVATAEPAKSEASPDSASGAKALDIATIALVEKDPIPQATTEPAKSNPSRIGSKPLTILSQSNGIPNSAGMTLPGENTASGLPCGDLQPLLVQSMVELNSSMQQSFMLLERQLDELSRNSDSLQRFNDSLVGWEAPGAPKKDPGWESALPGL